MLKRYESLEITTYITNSPFYKPFHHPIPIVLVILWVFLDVLYDPNKEISALWNFNGMLHHLFPTIVALLEVKFNIFEKNEICGKVNLERKLFMKFCLLYVFCYIGWSCIHYQIAGLTLSSLDGTRRDYTYAIFQFKSGGSIGLSVGLGIFITGLAILMGLGLERICFVNSKGNALRLNCCKKGEDDIEADAGKGDFVAVELMPQDSNSSV